MTIAGDRRDSNPALTALAAEINSLHQTEAEIRLCTKRLNETTEPAERGTLQERLEAAKQKRSELRDRVRMSAAAYRMLNPHPHPHPEWSGFVMQGAASVALGELQAALESEQQGLRCAEELLKSQGENETTRRLKASSLNNISAVLRRLGESESAVRNAMEAYRLWPVDAVAFTLAMAFFAADAKEAANAVIGKLEGLRGSDNDSSVVNGYMRYETDLREMIELPNVAKLAERLGLLAS